ncbi:MAG: sulfotransferase domain-containing protein, partial [Bacteroidota bacterium]
RWVEDVSAGLKYLKHPQVLTIKYENLVTDLPKELKRLSAFLNEDFEGLADNWHEKTQIKSTRAWFDGVQQVNTKSIGKWKRPEFQESTEQFMKTPGAQKLLKKLKYL